MEGGVRVDNGQQAEDTTYHRIDNFTIRKRYVRMVYLHPPDIPTSKRNQHQYMENGEVEEGVGWGQQGGCLTQLLRTRQTHDSCDRFPAPPTTLLVPAKTLDEADRRRHCCCLLHLELQGSVV